MNSTLLAFAVILLIATVGFADERQQLIGTWTCVSATIDGVPLSVESVKLLKLGLTADRFQTMRGEQVLFDSTYTVDPTKDPKQIDMIGTEGALKGKPAQGIYKLDGERLTLCYTMPGKERPAQFESPAKSSIYLLQWQRTKP